MKYLEDLNDAQRVAVEHTDGPTMVIAGAGSGKTRVLIYRIAHIISKGCDPFNILALTFTNKAAKEMKERIATILGGTEAQNIWMGTFHSVFARILRVEADKLGYPSNFTIYDTADSKNLLKTIIKEMALDDKVYKPALVYNRISSAKNNLISAQAYANNDEIVAEDRMAAKPRIAEIYLTYSKRCFRAGAMDFDDLLFNTNVLLRDFPEVLHKYQHKFKYVLVDEYQDTNYSQYIIVKKLAALNENVCVVGDDAQSIYAFRGANIQNILNFKNDYPDTKVFKLEQNYRSTQNIVNAANSIIAKNKDQIKKDVWTKNGEGAKIKVLRALTDNEEGRIVASLVFETKQKEQAANKDFAILYRTNSQSRSFEEALRKLNIPYKIYGGLSFYQRKEIKDILSYFRLVVNPHDEEALKRVINYPKRGIGKTTIESISVKSSENDMSMWNIISEPQKYGLNIPAGTKNKIDEFVMMIKSFTSDHDSKSAYELGSEIASSSGILKELYNDKTPEGISRYENIQELLNGMREFSEATKDGEIQPLNDFLIDVALLTSGDDDKENQDKVLLMSVHASKGLEFPYVYIVGMEENLFPSQMSLNSRSDLEEERRLFYVGLTRAEKKATLSFATSRYRWGNLISCEPSRFLEEVGEQFLEEPFSKWETSAKPKATSKKSAFDSSKLPSTRKLVKMSSPNPAKKGQDINTGDIQVGNKVKHSRFGEGKVVSLEGNYPNQKAVVFFQGIGQKQLLLKFAKLELID